MNYSDRNLRGLYVRSNTLFASIVKTLLFRPVECLGINWIILARLTHSVGLQGEPNAVFTMCTKTPICKEIKCPFPQKSVLYSSTSISVLGGDFPFHESVFFTLCTFISKLWLDVSHGVIFKNSPLVGWKFAAIVPVAESRFGLIKLQAEHNPALLVLCTRANVHFK